MGSQWRRQREELSQCKKTWKLSQVIIADSPTMKTFTKTGWTLREKLAAMLQCRSDWRLKQLLPKWKLKILEVGHRGVLIWDEKACPSGHAQLCVPTTRKNLLTSAHWLKDSGEFHWAKWYYKYGWVPLTFDLPLTLTVNKNLSITLKTSGREKRILRVFWAAQHPD